MSLAESQLGRTKPGERRVVYQNGMENSSVEKSSPGNMTLVSAATLAQKGYAIDVLPHTRTIGGAGNSKNVLVVASPDVHTMLQEIILLPGITTLDRAYRGAMTPPELDTTDGIHNWLELDKTSWDTETKQRVEALYWEMTAQHREEWAERERTSLPTPWDIRLPVHTVMFFNRRQEVKDIRNLAHQTRSKAEEILDGQPPITHSAAANLVKEAIDNYIVENRPIEEVERVLPLHEQTRSILEHTADLAEDHIGTEHLLAGILLSEEGGDICEELGIDVQTLFEQTVFYIHDDVNQPQTVGGKTLTVIETLRHAEAERKMREGDVITPSDLLVGMLLSETGMAVNLLKAAALNTEDTMGEFKYNTISHIRERASR